MQRLKMTLALMAFAATGLFAQSPTPAPVQKHVLQGAWVIETLGGKLTPPGVSLVLTVAADGTYTAAQNDSVEERGTIRVNTTKKPMTLDFIISDGSSAGKTQLGIFELAAGSLKMSLATPGSTTRPVDFTISPANELIVLKKKT